MAGWRRAVALAMTAEEIEALTALSRSRTEPARRCRGRKCCSPIASSRRFLPWDKDLAYIIRRCSAASSGRGVWRAGGARRPTATGQGADDYAGSQRLVGISGLREGQGARLSARVGTTRLLARHARERGPAAGHECLAHLAQGTVCKILGQEDIKPHKVRYYLERRDEEFEQRWRRFCVSIARSRS